MRQILIFLPTLFLRVRFYFVFVPEGIKPVLAIGIKQQNLMLVSNYP
jgi:hypothetical protein